MIDKITYTKEHLLSLVKKYKTDPQLLERAIFALGLLEAISKVSKDFCFKGGSSLMILTEKPSEYMMSFNERLLCFKEQRKKNPKYKWISFIKNKNNKD
jgi:hypothetical protein